MSTRSRRRPAFARLPFAIALLAPLAACNVIDVVIGRDAKIVKMVPGVNVATNQFDCWMTLQFNRYPEGADTTDVRVRFESIALDRPAEFDWGFIAANDVVPRGGAFNSGYKKAEHTRPDQPPPLGEPLKVRFPLDAREVIENAPDTLWFKGELYWGGKKQDSTRYTIEHAYESTPGGFF